MDTGRVSPDAVHVQAGSDRGSPKRAIALLSKRVIMLTCSPARVITIIPLDQAILSPTARAE